MSEVAKIESQLEDCAHKNHLRTATDVETGEVICINCGEVLSDKNIEYTPVALF
jgi:transcription initiation factor TFIIIB Brf1 subunit/transcription initiation factor TFIIB